MFYKIEPTNPNTSFFFSFLFFLGEISRWVKKANSLKKLFINQLPAKHYFQNAFNLCQLEMSFSIVSGFSITTHM
jgi:hypothetical protein